MVNQTVTNWPPAGVKWYYSDKWTAIACGDCREVIPKLDAKVDLVLTDPDYNAADIGPHKRQYLAGMPHLSDSDYAKWCSEWFNLAQSMTDNLIFTPGVKWLWNYPRARGILCWHKPASISYNSFGGYNAWEPILVYGNPFYRLGQDYLRFNTLNIKKGVERYHPCPKPESLWLHLISKTKSNLILDPFLGSGTTCYCAKKLNRYSIGVEIEERYCEIATNRCRQSVFEFEY